MPPNPRDPGDLTATMQSQLAGEMRSLMTAVQGLTNEMHQNAVAYATMRSEFTNVRETVDSLTRAFRDGVSGGIFGRIALLEEQIERIDEWTREQTKRQNEDTKKQAEDAKRVKDALDLSDKRDRESHWKFLGALVAALAGIVTAAIALLKKSP